MSGYGQLKAHLPLSLSQTHTQTNTQPGCLCSYSISRRTCPQSFMWPKIHCPPWGFRPGLLLVSEDEQLFGAELWFKIPTVAPGRLFFQDGPAVSFFLHNLDDRNSCDSTNSVLIHSSTSEHQAPESSRMQFWGFCMNNPAWYTDTSIFQLYWHFVAVIEEGIKFSVETTPTISLTWSFRTLNLSFNLNYDLLSECKHKSVVVVNHRNTI